MRRIVIAIAAVVVVALAFYAWALHRAFTGAVQQIAPTPAEKKIEASGHAKEAEIEKAADDEDKELENDSMDALIQRLRDRATGKLRQP